MLMNHMWHLFRADLAMECMCLWELSRNPKAFKPCRSNGTLDAERVFVLACGKSARIG